MSSMDLQGGLTFDPVAGGTRMRWSWDLEPKRGLRLMGPMITRMGRRSERTIWTSLKRLLEEQKIPPAQANEARGPAR